MNEQIKQIEKQKQSNNYFINNSIMFNNLIDLIKKYKKIKTVLSHKQYTELKRWIEDQTPYLKDAQYNILTKIYWIIFNIKDWSDLRVICPICKKPFYNKNIYRLRYGYSTRCSVKCMNKSAKHIEQAKQTYNEHLKNDKQFIENIINKRKTTKINKGYSANWVNSDKCKQTKLLLHNDSHYNNTSKARQTRYLKNNNQWHSKETLNKIKQTCLQHNGYECALANNGIRNTFNIKEIRQKALMTMRKNFTYNKSKQEDKVYELLCEYYGKINVERQYKSEKYPYQCDFYIKTCDLYIEYNGSWTHGKHAYNKNSTEDQKTLEKWKEKQLLYSYKKHNYYERAIYVWTTLDVNKRNIAKTNNLKFKEFWTISQVQKFISA